MQSDPGFYSGKDSPDRGYESGRNKYNDNAHYDLTTPPFVATLAGPDQEFPAPLNIFEFRPSENCPKKFIIFDQTKNKSRVMFHPTLAPKFDCVNFILKTNPIHQEGKNTGMHKENNAKSSSSHKEDTKDIDALLYSEEDEEDDAVSTGRTPSKKGGSSSDSYYSTEGFMSHKIKRTSRESFSSGSSKCEKKERVRKMVSALRSGKIKHTSRESFSSGSSKCEKKERVRKMVSALRGIIPGGENMDTPAILDEAVRYLKTLKMEVKKIGIHNFEN